MVRSVSGFVSSFHLVKAIASHLAGFGRFLASLDPPVTDLAVLDRRRPGPARMIRDGLSREPAVGGTIERNGLADRIDTDDLAEPIDRIEPIERVGA